MHPLRLIAFAVGISVGSLPPALAQNSVPPSGTLSKLPVREVTVFKDGHAFVLHEGPLPVDASGDIVLDNLPTPVVGTFWPYQVGGKLRGVVASREPVTTQRTALSVYELLKANIGAEVTVIDAGTPEKRFDAKILDVPQPPPSDAASGEPPVDRYRPLIAPQPTQPEVILLQTNEGVLARHISSISQVIFKTAPRQTVGTPEFRNLLRLQLSGGKRSASERVPVGMVYLQKGLRWIPSYRLALDGKGRADVQMQATLVNELVDLQDATANFVIGVPSFALKDTVDPLALQNTFARLSPLFEPASRSAGAFFNGIQSQIASNSYRLINNAAEQPGNAAGVPDAGTSEDFFIFTAKNLSLRKGERMSFPLAQYDLQYKDIYALETPAQPPVEIYRNLNYEQQTAISKSLQAPNVMHRIRLLNNGTQPLTTAPALIESKGRLLAQTLMTYTASGGRSDLDLAPAVDVTVKRVESEAKRSPNAMKWRGYDYSQVDVTGRLLVTSYRNEPITLELTQGFIGTVDKAEQGGAIRKLGIGDDEGGAAHANLPSWWNYDSGDWRAVNGLSAVKWTLTIPAKKSLEIPYSYHYYWR